MVIQFKSYGARPEGHGRQGSVFAEEIGKIGDLIEAQTPADFGDRPVGLPEQNFGLLRDAALNGPGGGAARLLFQYLVQVVDMNGQPVGIILRRAEGKPLPGRFDGKLPFEQFDKQRRHPRYRRMRRIEGRGGLQFLAVVNQFQRVGPQQVILVGIVLSHLLLHLLKQADQFISLMVSQLKNRIAARPENRR